ncbi:MAG TPA: hypothetical protein VFR50_08415 [Casimicrobiaceae bacterium]|jgi:hypothetical protein|nr:hypothetical protein [Casimicrobiaceae bacterium]
MGRLTAAVRRSRIDAKAWSRRIAVERASEHYPHMHDAAVAARDAGRSCYFRPLFDRPRHWAAQRTPRQTPAAKQPHARPA